MKYLLMIALLLPSFVFAGVAKDMADDPVMEKRMMHLAEKVRCLVCQSEPVSNSHSDWAQDVRQIMREKMIAGASDQ
ncbi:MAG: cytochrome c-type biogenesis protein CcmH, partial [Gallionella sp.]|nr:cytochrome c-type biogenesis protein CcmH [Gallionella sp.]